MNAGVWIGLIGGLVGLAVGIAAVIATADATGYYVSGGILLLIVGMGFLFYKIFFGPMLNAARLRKTGLPGKARILEVRETGVTINNRPQMKLILEVKNNLGQTYTTHCRVLLSFANPWAYQPGMELPVKIDPKNEKNVVIDTDAGAQTAATATGFNNPLNQTQAVNTAALQAELGQMQKDNEAILASGKPARAIIKKYTWLGIYVNGNNPYVELELEVLPELMPSFSGKARGVIAETSVQKYQPGNEIFVKYDLYDNSKVSIDHS